MGLHLPSAALRGDDAVRVKRVASVAEARVQLMLFTSATLEIRTA